MENYGSAGTPGRKCGVCTSARLAEITRALTRGQTFESISFEYGFAKSSLHRHATLHQGIKKNNKQGEKGASRGSGSGLRKRAAPISRSATDDEPLDAKGIIREAERILRRSEEIVTRAEDNDDFRLALAAIDRCQKAVDSLAKIAGLVGPDVVIDQRQQVNIYAGWPTGALQALQIMHDELGAGKSVSEAMRAVQSLDDKILALPS